MRREDIIKRSKLFFLFCILLYMVFWLMIFLLGSDRYFVDRAIMSSVVLSYNLLLYLVFLFEILNRYPLLKEDAKKKMKGHLFILQMSSIILSLISLHSETLAYISSTLSLIFYISLSSLIEKDLGYIFTPFITFILYKNCIQIPYYLFSLLILYLPSMFPFFLRKRKTDETILYILTLLSIISTFFENYLLALVFLTIAIISFLVNIPRLTVSYRLVGITITYSVFLVLLSLIGILSDLVRFFPFFIVSISSSLMISSQHFLFLLARRGVLRYNYKPRRLFLPIFTLLFLCTFVGSSLFFGMETLYLISSISLTIFLIPYLTTFWQIYQESIEEQ